jgi:hypothetical protein
MQINVNEEIYNTIPEKHFKIKLNYPLPVYLKTNFGD